MPEPHVNGRRWIAGVLLAVSLLTMLVAGARAEPIQLVKTFDSPLVGTAQFQITIETLVFGAWIAIPCVDNAGSCNYTFSDVAAGTSIVLADSSTAPWLTDGQYFIEEIAPPGWVLDAVIGTNTASLAFDRPAGEAFFSFALSEDESGRLELHNARVPGPGSLVIVGLGLVLLAWLPAILSRSRRR